MRKNKTIKLLFMSFMLLMAMVIQYIPFSFLQTQNNNEVVADSLPTVRLSFKSSADSNTTMMAGNNSYVDLYIITDRTINKTIEVRVKTVSMSAVADVDYTSIDNIYKIQSGSTYTKFTISTKSITYTAGNNLNQFAVEIVEVTSGNAEINDDYRTLYIENYSKDKLELVDTYFYKEQGKNSNTTVSGPGDGTTWYGGTYDIGGNSIVNQNATYDKYISYNLGTYTCYGFVELDEDWYDDDNDPIWMNLYDGSSSGTKLYAGGYYNLWEEAIYYGESYDGAEMVNGEYKNSTETFTYDGHMYMRVPTGTVRVVVVQAHNHDRYWRKQWFTWRVFDWKAPKIKNYYIDKSVMTKGQALRIQVRFDEPVHVVGTKPSINATLVGTGTFADKSVTFDYAGGSGTNTLYFDYIPDGVGTISNINIKYFSNSTSIYDYCRNTSNSNIACADLSSDSKMRTEKVRPIDFKSDLSVTFDNTNPSLDFQSETVDKWAKEHTVGIISDSYEFWKVDYEWSTESEKSATDTYKNSSDIKNFTTTLENENGTYYLHIVARSRYSVDLYTKKTAGPFYIDTDAPVVQYTNDSVGSGTKERQIHFGVVDFAGISKIYMYYDTEYFSDDNLSENEPLLVYDKDNSDLENIIATFEDNVFTISVNAVLNLGLQEGGKDYGDFYIGFKGVDNLGNVSKIYKLPDLVNFDIRNSFECNLYVDNLPIEENCLASVDYAYIIDIKNGAKDIKIVRDGLTESYEIDDFVKLDGNKRQSIKDIIGMYFTYKDKYIGLTNSSITYTTKETGYYEITMSATSVGETTYSKTIKLYIVNTDEQSDTYNYNKILTEGVNLKNNVYRLGNGKYFYRTGGGMGSLATSYYNNSAEPLIFSSKTKAIDYVRKMEFLDMYALRLTTEDVNNFRNGTMAISKTERKVPEVGQVWIRYKTSTWNFTSSVRDWAYYYYGDSSSDMVIEEARFSPDLLLILDSITNLIVNRGEEYRLSSISGLNENGVPSVNLNRIPKSEEYNETKSFSQISISYEYDKDIFNDGLITNSVVPFVTWYKFSFNYPTKIFFAPVDESQVNTYTKLTDIITDDFRKVSADNLREYITETGYYAVREIDDTGIREFLVYMDYTEPTIIVQYTDLNGVLHNNDNLDKSGDGRIIHTKDFSIRAFNDNADFYSHIDIFDIRTEKVLYKSFTLQEFLSTNVLNEHFDFPYGNYEVQVYDRSGNSYAFTVSVAEYALKANVDVIPDNKVVFTLDHRIANDVLEFEVKLNGKVIMTDYMLSSETINGLTGIYFYDSGLYEFTVTDVFGYTISETAELTRVNPAENIQWYIKREIDGGYDLLDEKALTEFGTNGYYITSDSALSFVLTDLEIYTYEIIGDAVTYETIEDGKMYVDIKSSAKWAVKIYYTRYPNYYVIYNRISATLVPPAPISLKTEVGYMDGDKIVQPDSANNIIIYVYADATITDEITVYLKTKNKTAIAELGDYEAYEGSVVLTPENPSARISIKTNPSGFTVYDTATGKYYSREFEIVITDIVGNGEMGDNKKLSCSVLGMTEVTATKNGDYKYFDFYLNGYKDYMGTLSLDWHHASVSSSDKNRSYNENLYYSVNTDWYSSFVETGLAQIYTTAGFTAYADDRSEASNLVVSLYDKDSGTRLYTTNLNKFEDNENRNISLGYSNGGAQGSSEVYDKASSITISSARGDATTGKYLLLSKSSLGNLRLNLYESSYTYIIYNSDPHGGSYSITYYDVPARYFIDMYGYSVLVDTSAPEITGYYLDHDIIRYGENLRLSVRFSEPVYVSGNSPIVNARVNGSSLTLQFLYAGGSGTDTLYFELNPESQLNEINVTGITIQSISNESSIHDYAYNEKSENNAFKTFIAPSNNDFDFSCSVDTRSPSILSSYVENERITKSVVIPITFSKVSAGATVQYTWSTEEEQPETFDNSLVLSNVNQTLSIESGMLSGVYYLHVRVTSLYGKVTLKTFGPIYLDCQAPVIRNLYIEEADKTLRERNVSFNVSDYPLEMNIGIDKVYMVYSTYGQDDFVTILLYNSELEYNKIDIDANGKMMFKLTYADLGMLAEEQCDFAIGFYASDKLGNVINFTNYTFYNGYVNFDSRSIVDVKITTDIDEIFVVDEKNVYDTTNGLDMRFIYSRPADEYRIKEVSIKGIVIEESSYSDYFTYESYAEGLHLTFSNAVSGYFTFKLISINGEHENQTTQESSPISFYLTDGVSSAETENYVEIQKGTLFINKVYYLNTEAKYYYHDGTSVKTVPYNDNTSLQAFSSKERAYDYIYFYEMQDLYALLIPTQAVASSLNNGDGSYRKAVEDSKVNAQVGQVWIRYKRTTWDNNQNPDSWVYYYYGNDTNINPSALSSSLLNAIATVTDTIVNAGNYSYLTSDNGLDKNGAPYLNQKQLHLQDISTYVTKCNSQFTNALTYYADTDIYNSTVIPTGYDACSVVTSYEFSYQNYTAIYYAKDYGRLAVASEFVRLTNGFTFSNLNIESGVYWIREVDGNGMRDFRAYIDKTAPTIKISYINSSETMITRELDSSIAGSTINGRTLYLNGISENEVDNMAYIALFKKSGVLVGVYRSEDFLNGGILIPEGQYYIEVMDRSGNKYTITIRLNTTPMVCQVVVSENVNIKITCNRDSADIATYEIYLDNELIESNYSPKNVFYQAGMYSIRIEDWYGNVYTREFELKRTVPQIDWSYEENASYILYDGTQDCISINKVNEREYKIVTNKRLMFSFETQNDYSYEFTDKTIQTSKQEFNGKTRIKINTDNNWTLKVYYTKYPNVYSIYQCIIDKTSPTITVSVLQETITDLDEVEIRTENQGIYYDGEEIYDPDKLTMFYPDTIYFTQNKIVERPIQANSTVFSNLLNVKFSDASVCNRAVVYINGEVLEEFSDSKGIADITLSRFGDYKIVAYDTLGNSNEFMFRNYKPNALSYSVDGKDVDWKTSPLNYMTPDENGDINYPIDVYGNTMAILGYDGNCEATFIIRVKGDDKYYYVRYQLNDNVLSQVTYRLRKLYNETTMEDYYAYEKTLSVINIPLQILDDETAKFRIATIDEAGIEIFAKVNSNKNIMFLFEAQETETTIEARFDYDSNYQPYFAKFVLSNQKPTITFVSTTNQNEQLEIAVNSNKEMTYLSGDFYIKHGAFEAENVTSIRVAYSKTTDFNDYQYIWYNREFTKINFSDEGFYSIIVENIYGTKVNYIALMSNTLNVVMKAIYDDEVSNSYSIAKDNITSNNKISLEIYTTDVELEVDLDGEITNSVHQSADGVVLVTFTEEGIYKVTIYDKFRNMVEKNFEIKHTEIEFNNSYLSNYNINALKYEQGYTNQKLKVEKELLVESGIAYMEVKYYNQTIVLFDYLREVHSELPEEELIDIIGSKGDGIYEIIIRDNYGSSVSKTIYYHGTPTLSVNRLIRTSNVPEKIELNQGKNELYTNYCFDFSTIANQYEMRIDGVKVTLPYMIYFPSDKDDIGEYIQNVTYIDEYGFSYEITVNLLRKKYDIDFSQNIKVVTIDDIVMTKEPVKLIYDDTAKATYTLNGGETSEYVSGTVLSKDGTYRFYITDIAGNISTATIKKDTIVEYIFTYSGSDRKVENGSVINLGAVKFSPMNRDSAQIETVLLNGEVYEDISATGFSQAGKWEFIIADAIGNSSYFMFYIINHSLSRFEYTTPYTFKITEILYDNGDGVPVSYINSVDQYENNSKMVFNDSGKYSVKATSSASSTVISFEIEIDKTPPKVELVGAEENSVTSENVELTGYQIGDTIEIYKDGKIYQTIHVTTPNTKISPINEKGEYRIVVTNEAGNSKELVFTRQYTANTATTIFIIAVLMINTILLFVYLMARKRVKVK